MNTNLEEMFKSGVHFGYSKSSRHPKMETFLFGLKNNIEIFDLEKTEQKLKEAKEFLKSLGKEKKKIIFVGTKIEAQEAIKNSAKEIEMFFVNKRWLGGTLTNFKAIKGRISYMLDLIKKKEAGELEKYTKKEQLDTEREIKNLDRYLEGLRGIETLPSVLIVVDPEEEVNAVLEANQMLVPVMAIMNSNCNPDKVNYVIPANDNSVTSIKYLLNELTSAYKEGLKEFSEEKPEDKKE